MIGPAPEHSLGQIGPAHRDLKASRACSERLVETDRATDKSQPQWFEPKNVRDWRCKHCSKPKSGHYGAPWLPSALLTCQATERERPSKGGRAKAMQRSSSDPSFETGIIKFTQRQCVKKSPLPRSVSWDDTMRQA